MKGNVSVKLQVNWFRHFSKPQTFSGAICNLVNGCAGFSWVEPDASGGMASTQNKCHLKSGNVTESIEDNGDVVSGLVGCPAPTPVFFTDCLMMDQDLRGGARLVEFENVETWQDCGNSRNLLFAVFY